MSDKSEVGLLLKALIGYNGNPSLTEVVGYLTYLAAITSIVLIGRRTTEFVGQRELNKKQSAA